MTGVFAGLFEFVSPQAAQARLVRTMAKRRCQQELAEQDEEQRIQHLAYDPERWPHCIDLPARHL